MEALHEPLGIDVSSVITDYLTLDEMRSYGIPITRDILARIIAPFKKPLTVDDYRTLLSQDYRLNVIEADILLNGAPDEFLEEVGLYMRFPQYINDLIVKSLIGAYTPETLNKLSLIISRDPGRGMPRFPRRNPHYLLGQGVDQTFNNTTVRRIIKRYINDELPIPEYLLNFIIETGNDRLIHKVMRRTPALLDLKYVIRALAYNQDDIGSYILDALLDSQIETQQYDLLSDVSTPTMMSLAQLVIALLGNPKFTSHIEAYISNIPPTHGNRNVFLALLSNSRIFEYTSKSFWLDIAARSEGRRLKRIIIEQLERM